MTTIFLFPGQGSQFIGMGKELFDRYTELMHQADSLVGYSIKQLCLEDPDNVLRQTNYTQVALYVVNALSYLHRVEKSATPDLVAGHSLGEYNALFAAGVFDFIRGLELVKKRGELMSNVCGGGMAAVLGMEVKEISLFLADNKLDAIDFANYNAPLQTVISGKEEDIKKAATLLRKMRKCCIPLKVSGAFHSRYMKEVQEEFRNYIASFSFCSPEIPVIANYTGLPYESENIKENMIQQITHSVRWIESIAYLRKQNDPAFEEIGPGKVLLKLLQQIRA